MKKLILVLFILCCSTIFCFAKDYKEYKQMFTPFWRNGNYIYIVNEDYTIRYINKTTVTDLIVTPDYITIKYSMNKETTIQYKEYFIALDNEDNIIIQKK